MSAEQDEAAAFIRSLVGAWDCCATCAGGVLLRHDRERMAQAWDEAVRSAHLRETEHWTGIAHDPNPYAALTTTPTPAAEVGRREESGR